MVDDVSEIDLLEASRGRASDKRRLLHAMDSGRRSVKEEHGRCDRRQGSDQVSWDWILFVQDSVVAV